MKKLFLLLILISPVSAHAYKIDEPLQKIVNIFLDDLTNEFYEANTNEKKYAVVKSRINFGVFELWWDSHKRYHTANDSVFHQFEKYDYPADEVKGLGYKKSQFYNVNSGHKNVTHALALAISVGRSGLVKEMLAVVPNINAQELDIKVNDSQKTLTHIALDPEHPRAFVSMRERLDIIDALGQKGLDFNRHLQGIRHPLNTIISNGWWYAEQHGHDHLYHEVAEMGARAFSYGVTPIGLFPNLTMQDLTNKEMQAGLAIYRTAFDMYTDLRRQNVAGLRLDPNVEKVFKLLKDEKLQLMQSMDFND